MCEIYRMCVKYTHYVCEILPSHSETALNCVLCVYTVHCALYNYDIMYIIDKVLSLLVCVYHYVLN